jgi:hypothetical protein
MRERLREIAQHPASFGIVLFEEQSDVIAQADELLE